MKNTELVTERENFQLQRRTASEGGENSREGSRE
jgi:hypothetical protein